MKTLSKGQKVALESELNSKNFNIGISWDQNSARGYDIDSSLLLLSESGKVENEEDFIFYNNPVSKCSSVKIESSSFNNYTKMINFDLNRISNSITKILLVLTIDNGYQLNQTFGNVKNLNIDIIDSSKQNIYLKYPIEGLSMETAIVTLEIYKHNNIWKVNAVGTGFNAGLDKILMQYSSDKIKIAEDKTEPTPIKQNSAPNPTPTPANNSNQNNNLNARYNGVLIEVDLKYGQGFRAESGAVASKDPSIDVEAKADSGIIGSLGRLMARESVKFDNIKAKRGDGKFMLSSRGSATFILGMDGYSDYYVQQNSFLGASDTIETETIMQNPLKGLLNKEGFSITKAKGMGTLIIKAETQKIEEINLVNGQDYMIDNRYLIAWPTSVVYKVHQSSKELIANYKSGQPLTCMITGPGKIYIKAK